MTRFATCATLSAVAITSAPIPPPRVFPAPSHGRNRQKAKAGAILHIGHDGQLGIMRGLIRPEDIKAAKHADDGEAAAKKLSSLQALLPLLEAVVQTGKPLLIGAVHTITLTSRPSRVLALRLSLRNSC